MNLSNMCRFGLLPFLLAAGAGCSDMNPSQDTYETVYGPLQVAGAGGEPGGGGGTGGDDPIDPVPAEWACLETPPTPYQAPTPGPPTINYIVPIVDFDTKEAMEGLTVKLCTSSSCVPDVPIPPVVRADPVLPIFLIQLPFGQQDSYLQLSAPNYATMDYYFGGPIIGSPNEQFVGNAIPMLLQETLDKLLVDVRAPSPSEPGRGVLAIRTINCMGARAANVVVEPVGDMPAGAVPWTLSDNNVALRGATTDGRGVAGFANVPEGSLRVQGVAPVGDGIEYGAHTLRVKAGQITLGEVRLGIGQFGQ